MICGHDPADTISRHSYRGRPGLDKTENQSFKLERRKRRWILRASKFLLAFQHTMAIALGDKLGLIA